MWSVHAETFHYSVSFMELSVSYLDLDKKCDTLCIQWWNLTLKHLYNVLKPAGWDSQSERIHMVRELNLANHIHSIDHHLCYEILLSLAATRLGKWRQEEEVCENCLGS